jgi:hypothetical protein
MDVLGALINGLVVATSATVLGWLFRGRFRGVEARIDRLKDRFEHRFDLVEHRFDLMEHRFDLVDRRFELVDRRFEGLEGRLDVLRSDLTAVALAVGAPPRSGQSGRH